MIVNALVFWSWRLSFPQLASASDVVNSGLQLVWAVSLAAAAASLGAGVWHLVRREVPPQSLTLVSTAFKIVAAAVTLAAAVGVATEVARQPEKATQLDIWLGPYVLLAFAAGYGAAEKAARGGGPRDQRVRQALNDVFLIVGGVSLVLLLANMNFVAHFGFFGSPYRVEAPELPKGCEGPVLWTGERAIVVRCEVGVRPTVIIGPENAILVPIVKAKD